MACMCSSIGVAEGQQYRAFRDVYGPASGTRTRPAARLWALRQVLISGRMVFDVGRRPRISRLAAGSHRDQGAPRAPLARCGWQPAARGCLMR